MCSWSRLGVGRVMRGRCEPHHREGREVVLHRGRGERGSEPLVRFGPHIVGRGYQSHEHCLTNGHRPLKTAAAQWVQGANPVPRPARTALHGASCSRGDDCPAPNPSTNASRPWTDPAPGCPAPPSAPTMAPSVAAPMATSMARVEPTKKPPRQRGLQLGLPPGATTGIRRPQPQSFFLDLAATAGWETPPLTLTSVILPPMR